LFCELAAAARTAAFCAPALPRALVACSRFACAALTEAAAMRASVAVVSALCFDISFVS
jgi:hypothetical protein